MKKTLYVHRPVLNTDEIAAWFKDQGILTTLGDDMHVTLAFSREPVDWDQWKPRIGKLTIYRPFPFLMKNNRKMALFGDENNVLVEKIFAPPLEARWKEFIAGGASWDHDGFSAHITITYNPPDTLPDPFEGNIIFGPEVFDELDEDWESKKKES
jgi:hypothetical protein